MCMCVCAVFVAIPRTAKGLSHTTLGQKKETFYCIYLSKTIQLVYVGSTASGSRQADMAVSLLK